MGGGGDGLLNREYTLYGPPKNMCVVPVIPVYIYMLNPHHNIQQQNNNHTQNFANYFTEQFTNSVKHAMHNTNRSINRATHKIQGYNITLTTTLVQVEIKQSKNCNPQGPAKLNIRHLKHIGPLGLVFLTTMFKTALNNNIIPHNWRLAK